VTERKIWLVFFFFLLFFFSPSFHPFLLFFFSPLLLSEKRLPLINDIIWRRVTCSPSFLPPAFSPKGLFFLPSSLPLQKRKGAGFRETRSLSSPPSPPPVQILLYPFLFLFSLLFGKRRLRGLSHEDERKFVFLGQPFFFIFPAPPPGASPFFLSPFLFSLEG